MNSLLRNFVFLSIAWLVVSHATQVSAQSDRLYDRNGKSFAGKVVKVAAEGVQVKKGSDTQTYLANDILKILYDGDPKSLTRGRELALEGQFEQALDELKKVKPDSIKRDVIEADYAFYVAYCQAQLALAGRSAKDPAAKTMLGFAGRYRSSWHFYEAARVLGDLALAIGDPQKALQYYSSIEKSPSPDSKILSRYLRGRAYLKADQTDEALEQFDAIIGLSAQSEATIRLQVLATAGKAVALSKKGDSAQGIKLVNSLITQLNTSDIELASRVYNALGASHEASGDSNNALLAYLHTHLMFSSQPDAHSEALLRLIDLWTKLGKLDRAAEARLELQKRYPGAK